MSKKLCVIKNRMKNIMKTKKQIFLMFVMVISVFTVNAVNSVTSSFSQSSCVINFEYQYLKTSDVRIPIHFTEIGSGGDKYFLYKNGSIIETGGWQANTTLWLRVDTLPVGLHNYTIAMKDIAGNIGACSYMITITPNYAHLPSPATTGFNVLMVITMSGFLIIGRKVFNQRKRGKQNN
ncbi:MAG: hypothetical protein HeimC3_52450 [Candidatus Heimdallarchaeota archaeon LC_3]|nr:MAG: hypothetical protein HeimC3_52450 [Candidatus Heimdallarchaeota archaeon LC_3]